MRSLLGWSPETVPPQLSSSTAVYRHSPAQSTQHLSRRISAPRAPRQWPLAEM